MPDQKNSLAMDQKTASWFAYVLSVVSAIILLVTEKENKAVRTHAWQSLVMGCVFIVVYILLSILSAIFFPWNLSALYAYATGGFVIFSILNWIVSLGWLVLTVICIVKALQGDIFKVPVVYGKVKDLK